jgi:hypothetical protein
MSLLLSVPVPDVNTVQFCAAVAKRTRELFDGLGQPVEVVAKPGNDLATLVDNQITPLPEGGILLPDPLDRIVARLIGQRVLLLRAAVTDDVASSTVDRVGRLLLTRFACRDDGTPWPTAGSAEDELAARMSRTDSQPLVIGLDHGDAQRLFQDQVDSLDAALRQHLYDSSRVALPPAVQLGGAEPGTATIRVRDVVYPVLNLPNDEQQARNDLLRYWTRVVETEREALVTPIGLEAILVQTNAALPKAAALALKRWPPSSLINLVRCWLHTVDSGPSDLPAIIERAALTPRLSGPRDGSDADVLARQFPGFWTAVTPAAAEAAGHPPTPGNPPAGNRPTGAAAPAGEDPTVPPAKADPAGPDGAATPPASEPASRL